MSFRSPVSSFLFASLSSLIVALFVLGCVPPTGRSTGDKDPNNPIIKDDPNRDGDGDGYTPKQGDCNDHDTAIHPNAEEVCDGKDNDCDGTPDPDCDNDMDGYTKNQGDCNDGDPLTNPGAMDVADDGADNNCDNQIDEVAAACDTGIVKSDAKKVAGAFELCGPWVVSATWSNGSDARAYDVKTAYGMNYKPKQGANFLVLSTGIAADKDDSGYTSPQSGTSFNNTEQNPYPMTNTNACYSGADPTEVNDYVELTLKLKVPTNAKSFSFQFNFMSAEYPEFVGTEFNDKFLVLLDSKSYKGNISFDKNKNPITVNVGFFDVCNSASVCGGTMTNTCTKPSSDLNGTGYEMGTGGGTGWLTTTSPVTPGETATLRFIIFDEGDHIYDSAVLIDNFQWQVESSMGPTTIG